MEVVIRGVVWPDVRSAADAYSVKPASIYRARALGRLDRVGSRLDRLSVSVRGITYATVAEAAHALGVDPVTVYSAMGRGKLDTLGLRSTPAGREEIARRRGEMAKAVTIRAITYPNCQAAARALGVALQTVYTARQRGTLDTVGVRRGRPRPAATPMVTDPRRDGPPITIGPTTYPSHTAAAMALRIPRARVTRYALAQLPLTRTDQSPSV